MDEEYYNVGWTHNRGRGSPTTDDDDSCDDGPLLSYKYDNNRHTSTHWPRSRRRPAATVIVRVFLFCAAMMSLSLVLYIPLYSRADTQMTKSIVAGWSYHTNRDTKIYVQPKNVTTIHEPATLCRKHEKKKLYLLIVVCSSTVNFERRLAIRETWGNYQMYLKAAKIYNEVKKQFKNYNYTYDLYPDPTVKADNVSLNVTPITRLKRSVGGFAQLLPQLAVALQNNLDSMKSDKPIVEDEKRFPDEENDKNMLPEFDMNKQFDDNNGIEKDDNVYDYDYESNVMKIPPNGEEDNPDLSKILERLKSSNFGKKKELTSAKALDNVSSDDNAVLEPVYKVVFLLGVPSSDNSSEIQNRIDDEVMQYRDIIQENFIDSYNNLTLKSLMLLKWVSQHCDQSLRYVLKTDDDMYINIPNLIETLQNKSKEYDNKVQNGYKEPEYLLLGDLICGARPVSDASNKWYSPRYMYSGRVYPRYLSGTGYVMSRPTVLALYDAALTTPYFHLEDIYVTGICSQRSKPRIPPRDSPAFSYQPSWSPCLAHSHATMHLVSPARARSLALSMLDEKFVVKCEKIRLTEKRKQQNNLKALYNNLRSFYASECS